MSRLCLNFLIIGCHYKHRSNQILKQETIKKKKGLKMHENAWLLPVNAAEKSGSQIAIYGQKRLLNIAAHTAPAAGTALAEDLPGRISSNPEELKHFLVLL